MTQSCWGVWPDRGFLIHPDPLTSLTGSGLGDAVAEHLESIMAELPDLIEAGRIRATLEALPVYDVQPLIEAGDCRAIERARGIYAYFANAAIHTTGQPEQRIPRGIALPLVALSAQVGRPPILDYASYTLNNWRRIDADGPIVVDNLRLNHTFLHIPDSAWFTLIHVDIEARAAQAVSHIEPALMATANGDEAALMGALEAMQTGLDNMMASFRRMTEGCRTDVYYHTVRPYMFGFEDVIYEGAFSDQPQTYPGETGAQSSVIPALVKALGLQHQEGGLSAHLRTMRHHMPRPHRDFIDSLDGRPLRAYVTQAGSSALRDAYNGTLQAMLAFRQLHLGFAQAYIASKVDDPKGTGGTLFMTWLKKLADETNAQLL